MKIATNQKIGVCVVFFAFAGTLFAANEIHADYTKLWNTALACDVNAKDLPIHRNITPKLLAIISSHTLEELTLQQLVNQKEFDKWSPRQELLDDIEKKNFSTTRYKILDERYFGHALVACGEKSFGVTAKGEREHSYWISDAERVKKWGPILDNANAVDNDSCLAPAVKEDPVYSYLRDENFGDHDSDGMIPDTCAPRQTKRLRKFFKMHEKNPGYHGVPCVVILEDFLKDTKVVNLDKLCKGESSKARAVTEKELKRLQKELAAGKK